jgi:hypothetical protein
MLANVRNLTPRIRRLEPLRRQAQPPRYAGTRPAYPGSDRDHSDDVDTIRIMHLVILSDGVLMGSNHRSWRGAPGWCSAAQLNTQIITLPTRRGAAVAMTAEPRQC